MLEKEKLFLTVDEALVAVRIAFTQYPFQLNLLSAIWPLVFGEDAYIQQDPGNRSVWFKISGKNKLVQTDEDDLKNRILEQLYCSILVPEKLVKICELVFGARVSATYGKKERSSVGICIDTDMDGFACVQCGHCCRTLSIKDGCTESDYKAWQKSGRADILDWVGVVRENEQVVAYRIWMVPGTNEYSRSCPWVNRISGPDRYGCSIYDIRPTVCRQYPGSRKHARLTGCRGVLT